MRKVQGSQRLSRRVALAARGRMQLIRRTTRFGEFPDLFIFECQDCGERHIEEGEPPLAVMEHQTMSGGEE